MFTQCPECQTSHRISVGQLRSSHGIMFCSKCSAKFNALERLNENMATINAWQDDVPAIDIPWEKSKRPESPLLWGLGCAACLLLLFAQLYYFQGSQLVQKPGIRPWIETLCQPLSCRLPVYKNLQQLTIRGVLQHTADNVLQLQAVLANQAPFPQAYPDIKLTLMEFNGRVFAERVFHPADYLSESAARLLDSEGSIDITLDIAKPVLPIGGYTLELL